MGETDRLTHVRLAGGVVAYRDERWLPDAIGSLKSQQLPPGVEWSGIWLVVSPGGDRTVEVARELARSDPTIRLILEPMRRGKSAALTEILGRAQGDLLVLLNGDARAEEGAVAALCLEAPKGGGAFAVTGRPVPSSLPPGLLGAALDLMWSLLHELHLRVLRYQSTGTHVSDELLLLPLDNLPPLRAGIVNDGAFIGGWVSAHGGKLRYAVDARVAIVVPDTWRDHIQQRRRIVLGHRQVAHEGGRPPTTIGTWAVANPRRAWRMLRQLESGRKDGWLALLALVAAEIAANLLARWDILRGQGEPSTWKRIGGVPVAGGSA